MTNDEAMNALVTLAREINPNLPADISGHTVSITMSRHGVTATARPHVELPKAEPKRRQDWHYDSQGYCDNPGRGY